MADEDTRRLTQRKWTQYKPVPEFLKKEADEDKPITQRKWIQEYKAAKTRDEITKRKLQKKLRRGFERRRAGRMMGEDAGTPYPMRDENTTVEQYSRDVEEWKKDNPSAARKLAVQKKRERPEPRPEGASPEEIGKWERTTPLTRRKWLSAGGKVYASSTRKAKYTAG